MPLPDLRFVGLGNMGAPMCHRLLAAGYSVSVFDIDAEEQPTRSDALID